MAMMSGIVGGAGQLAGGIMSKNAADDASKMQWNMYNKMRGDLMPYMQGGAGAFSSLGNLLGLGGASGGASALSTLQNMPGYQFSLQQGQQGVDRGMAARGLGISGGEAKDIDQYSQGFASQNYNNLVSQLMGMSGMGESAASGVGTAGMGAATNAGEAGMYGAAALGAGINGATNSMFGGQGGFTGLNWGQVGQFAGQFSDRRLKEDVVPVGKLESGLPVYLYRFKGSALPTMGVMADEVEKVAPEAVRTHPSGFKQVDYGRVAALPAHHQTSKLPAMRMAA